MKRRPLFFLVVAAAGIVWSCATDDAGPTGAITGTVLDSGAGAVAPTVRLANEAAGASFVGATSTEIFWVAGGHTIRAVKKTAPTAVRTVADRPDRTVTNVVANDSGYYWLEDADVVALRGDTPTTLFTASAPLDRLVLSGSTLAATAPNDAGLVTLVGGTPSTLGDVIADDRGLATDGTTIFFTRGNADVMGLDLDGGLRTLIVGLGFDGPRELAVDPASVYTSADVDGGKAIFQLPKGANGLVGDAAAPATFIPLLPDAGSTASLLLRYDGANLVYGNRFDGTIFRIYDGGASSVATVPKLNSLAADADGVYYAADDGTVAWVQR